MWRGDEEAQVIRGCRLFQVQGQVCSDSWKEDRRKRPGRRGGLARCQQKVSAQETRASQSLERRNACADHMRVDFPYVREWSSSFGTVARPLAKVIMEGEFPQWMYVDSGADITLIPSSVGKLVGLRRGMGDRSQRIFGVGRSSVPVLIKRISMRLGSAEFRCRVAWSQVEDVPLLLGRMDVFKRFNVTFKEKEGLTTFSC